MPVFIKAIFCFILILGILILPSYLWSILDRDSYENFILKGVSPFSQKVRNSLSQKKKIKNYFFKKNSFAQRSLMEIV